MFSQAGGERIKDKIKHTTSGDVLVSLVYLWFLTISSKPKDSITKGRKIWDFPEVEVNSDSPLKTKWTWKLFTNEKVEKLGKREAWVVKAHISRGRMGCDPAPVMSTAPSRRCHQGNGT